MYLSFKAILARKLIVPEMEEVLKKVAKLSVTGSNGMIRIHCRQVLALCSTLGAKRFLRLALSHSSRFVFCRSI